MHITVFAGKRSRSGTRHEPRASRHESVDAQMATGMLTRIDAQTCAEMYMAAARIKDAAGSLAIAADTLAALDEGKTRQTVEIVNKPEIKSGKE